MKTIRETIYILFAMFFALYAQAASDICSFSPLSGDGVTGDEVVKTTYNNPIIPTAAPDPCIIRAQDGYFYVYGTQNAAFDPDMPIYRSKDLASWLYAGSAFSSATHPRSVNPTTNAGLWAPDINYINGQYVLYYSAGYWGEKLWDSGVGVATSERPEGPFCDRGLMFIGREVGVYNSIDQFYIEDNGKKYMAWGSENGIYIIQLTDDGLRLMPGATKTQLVGNSVEGTYIYHNPKNGYYYLFASAGSCCSGASSTYHIVYGRSKSLFGPYLSKSGGRMLDGEWETLIESNDFVAGPGHNAEIVTDDNGDTWMPYCGYLKSDPGRDRPVFLDEVKWKNNWPYIEGGTPSKVSRVPYFKNK